MCRLSAVYAVLVCRLSSYIYTYIHESYLRWPNVPKKLLNHCQKSREKSLVGNEEKLKALNYSSAQVYN